MLTALTQIAAEELDVALDRITILSGDTRGRAGRRFHQRPASRSRCPAVPFAWSRAELRARIVDRLAQRLNCSPADIAVEDGAFLLDDEPDRPRLLEFRRRRRILPTISQGTARPKPTRAYTSRRPAGAAPDLPAKVTGAAFIHDIVRPDMLHARILRQPARGATLAALNEAAVRRAAGGDFRMVRVGNFVAFVGADETVVQRAAAAAPAHATWDNVRQLTPAQQEAAWYRDAALRRSADRRSGAGRDRRRGGVSATYSRPFVAHAAMAPSCALAEYRDGHLCRSGRIPRASIRCATRSPTFSGLNRDAGHRAARAWRRLLWPQRRRRRGAGCGGDRHATPGSLHPRAMAARGRVRLRTVRHRAYDPHPGGARRGGKPSRLDLRSLGWFACATAGLSAARCWRTRHCRPLRPPPKPNDPPEANGGGGTRNGIPLYDFPAKRIIHHLALATPVRTSSLRGLGALPNVFATGMFH